ncbi:MAG: hypothetical protein LBJ11_00335 [Oscillospiraceae bacterium]|jgi:hypothetical protein|nr:hypothetical protein [Oscillospiraceae bacterium]
MQKLLSVLFIFPMLFGELSFALCGTYYAWEAELACRDRGTDLALLREASLGLSVMHIGSDAGQRENAAVTFHPCLWQEGYYYLNIYYISGDGDRYFDLEVNGETQTVACSGNGGWESVACQRVRVPLRRGRNTLRFSCADWYAPNLDRITITKEPPEDLPPDPIQAPPDPLAISRDGITLTLDRANGVFSVEQDGRTLLRDAFCAMAASSVRRYAQEYDSHTADQAGDMVTFTHESGNLPAMTQTFRFAGDHLLISVTGAAATNWIAPIDSVSGENLPGGSRMLKAPFDNDDYAAFEPVGVNSTGESHELTALLDDEGGSAVVIGSVTHDTWKTGIAWRGQKNKVTRFCVYGGAADKLTRDTQPHGTVTGAAVTSPTIFLGAFSDWRAGLNAYGAANAAVAPPLPWDGGTPLGWNSWGVAQFNLDTGTAYAVSDYYQEQLRAAWQSGGEPVYINLDAGWDKALPSDGAIREFVASCAAKGQKVGLYYTPFACWSSAEKMKDSPYYDALLRDGEGNILPAWDGALAFDVTHPAIVEKIRRDIQRFLDTGVAYLKMDFLSHGAMEGAHSDPAVQTGLQAYNQAMARIADQVDGRMFLNLSIAPIFPHQYANGRRLACDTFYSIQHTRYMLNSLTFGFWESQIYACPDPDHIVVWGDKGQALEREGRARVTSGILAASFLAGDNFAAPAGNGDKARERFGLLQNPEIMALARDGRVFQPARLPEGSLCAAADVYVLRDGGTTYLAVFNFGLLPRNISLDLAALTEQTGPYALRELWTGEESRADGGFRANVPGCDARVYRVERAGS